MEVVGLTDVSMKSAYRILQLLAAGAFLSWLAALLTQNLGFRYLFWLIIGAFWTIFLIKFGLRGFGRCADAGS